MTKLLSIITLVLALVLFPPAALAVVSNNAVPGDSTYPIKRGLEDVIYAVASLNPNTKALFAKARSDRRFQEITTLLTQGKDASKTLNELVEQTRAAANQIDQVSDLTQRAKLTSQLSDSITKYDQGLSQVSQLRPQASPAVQPSVLTQTPAPAPLIVLSPRPDPELERTREELEKIKERLAESERQRQMQLLNQPNQVQSPDQSPSPSSSPSLNPSPNPSSSNQNMNRGKINQEIKKDNPKKASDSSQREMMND
ncbi:DUF5667 domain-containing protein [Patescibacteria group bacterium]|nr:DUF5667 domain-containing protein [Patescibacteria group bacterium]